MNIKLTDKSVVTSYTFQIKESGKTYDAIFWLNEKGKFIDIDISLNGEKIDGDDDDGVYDRIVSYVDANWDNLVK
jgi:hypothetical protein